MQYRPLHTYLIMERYPVLGLSISLCIPRTPAYQTSPFGINAPFTSSFAILYCGLLAATVSHIIIECICAIGDEQSGYSIESCSLLCTTRWLLNLSLIPSALNFSTVKRWVLNAGIPAEISSFLTGSTAFKSLKTSSISARSAFAICTLVFHHCAFLSSV